MKRILIVLVLIIGLSACTEKEVSKSDDKTDNIIAEIKLEIINWGINESSLDSDFDELWVDVKNNTSETFNWIGIGNSFTIYGVNENDVEIKLTIYDDINPNTTTRITTNGSIDHDLSVYKSVVIRYN